MAATEPDVATSQLYSDAVVVVVAERGKSHDEVVVHIPLSLDLLTLLRTHL